MKNITKLMMISLISMSMVQIHASEVSKLQAINPLTIHGEIVKAKSITYNQENKTATITDDNGMVYSFSNVIANPKIDYQAENEYVKIGSYLDTSTAGSTKKGGRYNPGPYRAGTITNLYGRPTSN